MFACCNNIIFSYHDGKVDKKDPRTYSDFSTTLLKRNIIV